MKIDLYNNHETFVTERKQDSAINACYRDLGLTARDIERHNCISDLSILINIRNSFWHLMTNHEKGIWNGSWGNVFKYNRFIRPKTLKKLEQLVIEMPIREQRLQQQRQTIMALRNKNTEPLKRDHDNKANGSHSHSSHVWTVAYESATDYPYF